MVTLIATSAGLRQKSAARRRPKKERRDRVLPPSPGDFPESERTRKQEPRIHPPGCGAFLRLGRGFQAPQHFLCFLPEPQGQGSSRPILGAVRTGIAPAGGGLFLSCQ